MFAALVTLHRLGVVPERGRLIWDLAVILETTMNTWGRYLFIIIAIGALFSSQLAITDGATRLWTDFFRNGFKFARNWTTGKCYLYIAPSLMVVGTLSTWFFETFEVSVLDFFFLSAVINGFAMAVYTPLVLYVNLRFLPKSAHPKPLNIFMVGCATLLYGSFALYAIWTKVGPWLS